MSLKRNLPDTMLAPKHMAQTGDKHTGKARDKDEMVPDMALDTDMDVLEAVTVLVLALAVLAGVQVVLVWAEAMVLVLALAWVLALAEVVQNGQNAVLLPLQES